MHPSLERWPGPSLPWARAGCNSNPARGLRRSSSIQHCTRAKRLWLHATMSCFQTKPSSDPCKTRATHRKASRRRCGRAKCWPETPAIERNNEDQTLILLQPAVHRCGTWDGALSFRSERELIVARTPGSSAILSTSNGTFPTRALTFPAGFKCLRGLPQVHLEEKR